MDLCEQTDEVMVLSEIFGDKLFEFDEKHSKGQISNAIELNGSVIKIGVSKRTINDNHEREILLSKDLDHIPPISLVFEFPANYPSVSMPKFSLSCLWLNSKQILLLEEHLESLWNENKGSVILFNWITFLQNEVLEFLDFEKEIIIEEKEKGFFHESLFTCNICFQEKFGKECVQFKGCDHVYCKICMRSYFETKIQEGSESGIVCPTYECSFEALPTQIKELVSEKNFTLIMKTDKLIFPTIIDIKSSFGECPACGFVFCSKCLCTYHGINPCKDPLEKLRELIDKTKDEESKKKLLEDSQNETLCLDLIEKISRHCPKCLSSIQKSAGCNSMVCTKCSTRFCYICGIKLPITNPFEHYSDKKKSVCQSTSFSMF
ncbi:RNF14 [Lepeophtheirus salmonis]|uniref:RNF14 n=1 Tax=Lepeophtheirus salmonis TaxID=72036 RepID=A0A7R8HDN7_LEPSM|nr:RNF14 [Lepeophtheirus salmonis]CAF3014635.1 RNF14 [Lepeophtheirus salmonis]